jgi:hypothetical protein
MLLLNHLIYLKKFNVSNSIHAISPILPKSIQKPMPNRSQPNWHVNKSNFIMEDIENICDPGTVTFSAGWLGQGHEVS